MPSKHVQIIIHEKRGLESATYGLSDDGIVAKSKQRVSAQSGKRVARGNIVITTVLLTLYSIRDFLASIFLPDGYPDSVSDDYLTYQAWDTLQALCSSITGLLSTQAMLQSVFPSDYQEGPPDNCHF